MARVLLVATARDGVDEVVRGVQAAGLRPTTADLSPLALVRAAARSRPPDPAGTEAVVDVGAEKVAVAVHTGGLPRFVRVIPGVGGATLTRALADLRRGPGRGRGAQAPKSRPRPAPALGGPGPTLRGVAQQMSLEVQETLRFYAASDPEHPPRRVVLTGLGAAGPGFDGLCRAPRPPGLPPRAPPPALRGTLGPEADSDLAVSYGLCLGAAAC